MNNTTASEKTIERIKKMLKLAGNNPNEHEADTAMQMALRLMAKHGLEMEDFSDEAKVGRREVDDPLPDTWRAQMAMAIAELYFCEYFTVRIKRGKKRSQRHVFVGRPEHTEAAASIAWWLIKATESTATRAWRAEGMPKGYRVSFYRAALGRIWQRVEEMIREAKETGVDVSDDAEPGTALVPLDTMYAETAAANKKWLSENVNLTQRKTRASSSYSSAGAAAGDAYGSSVSLRNQLS